MAELLSVSLIASAVGSSSSDNTLRTAQWALDNYSVGSRYSGNTIVADPLCYGVYFYFTSANTNNGSSGVSEWKCILKRNTSPAVLYHELKIIVPEGYGLPTTYNANSLFGIKVSMSTANLAFQFSVTKVGEYSPITSTVSVSNTNWMKTGGRVCMEINSNGTISYISYYAPSTTYINAAKTALANGVSTSDLDCYTQNHILRT